MFGSGLDRFGELVDDLDVGVLVLGQVAELLDALAAEGVDAHAQVVQVHLVACGGGQNVQHP